MLTMLTDGVAVAVGVVDATDGGGRRAAAPPPMGLIGRRAAGMAAGPVSAPAPTGGLGWARAVWGIPSPRMMRTKGTTKLPAAITTADLIRRWVRVRGSCI